MLLGEHYELRHHHFRLRFTELNEIYIFNSLRSLACTFVTYFIPIYLYINKGSLRIVFFYYLLLYGSEFLMQPISARIIKKIGPKHTIALSVPVLLLHLWLLQTLEIYDWPIYAIALSGGLALSLFWQAYHFDFSKSKRKKKAASDVSKQYVMIYLLAIIAPLIGGYLMDSQGPYLTFGLVLLILLSGTLVLFKTSDNHQRSGKINLKKLNLKSIARDALSYAGYGWEAIISMTIWPLFIFFIIGNYSSLGLLISVSLLVSAVIMYLVGKKSDKDPAKKNKYIKSSGLFKSALYFTRWIIKTLPGVYVVNILNSLANAFFVPAWVTEYYLHADEESRSEYIFVMESTVVFARMFLMAILIVCTFFLSNYQALIIGLLLGGIGALISTVIEPTKYEVKLDRNDFKLMPRPKERKNND